MIECFEISFPIFFLKIDFCYGSVQVFSPGKFIIGEILNHGRKGISSLLFFHQHTPFEVLYRCPEFFTSIHCCEHPGRSRDPKHGKPLQQFLIILCQFLKYFTPQVIFHPLRRQTAEQLGGRLSPCSFTEHLQYEGMASQLPVNAFKGQVLDMGSSAREKFQCF